jgi:hypothetical protein
MGFKIEIKNTKEFQKFMDEKQKAVAKTLPEGVKEATIYLQNKIKDSIARGTNAPIAVDTGRFLNSVDFAVVDENTSKVFTDLEYSKFIEFGTSRMASRPHFRNTLFVEQGKILQDFSNKLKMNVD